MFLKREKIEFFNCACAVFSTIETTTIDFSFLRLLAIPEQNLLTENDLLNLKSQPQQKREARCCQCNPPTANSESLHNENKRQVELTTSSLTFLLRWRLRIHEIEFGQKILSRIS